LLNTRIRAKPTLHKGKLGKAPWCDQSAAHPSQKAAKDGAPIVVIVLVEGWATRLGADTVI